MTTPKSRDLFRDPILESLAYRRNEGAELKVISSVVRYRFKKKPRTKEIRAALNRLEEDGTAKRVGERWFLTPSGRKQARGFALKPSWLPEDAWILLSMISSCSSDGGQLDQIIGAADYIDRAIPTLEELHGALNRLAAGRLITRRRGAFYVTERGLAIYAKIEGPCKKNVRSQRQGLRRLLDCPCCGVPLKSVRWRIDLDEASWKDAVQKYRKRFRG